MIPGAELGTSVGRRVVALFIVCAMVPLTAVLAVAYDRMQAALIAQRVALLHGTAATYGTSIVEQLTLAEHLAAALAADAAAGRLREHPLRTYFKSVVVLGGRSPQVLFGTPLAVPRAYEAPPAGDLSARLALVGAVGAEPAIWLLYPGHSGTAVAFELAPQFLWGASEGLPYLTDICVLSASGAQVRCDGRPPEEVRAAVIASDGGARKRPLAWRSGEARFIGAHSEIFLRGRYGIEPWVVLASQPESEALAPVRALRDLVAPVVILTLLLAALFGLVQVRRTLRPLKELSDATARIGVNDFGVRVPATRRDEFGALARAFNAMSDRLGRHFTALRAQAEIDSVILSGVDLPRVAEIAVARMRELVPADWHAVLLLEPGPGGHRLYDKANGEGVEGQGLSLEPGAVARLLSASKGLRVLGLDPLPVPGVRGVSGGSVLILPFALGKDLAAAILIRHDQAQVLDSESLSILWKLGDRILVAVTAAKREIELYRRAYYDSLTGLPNRQLGLEELERAVASAERHSRQLAILFVDLDGFSDVNDSHGHAAGDEVLVQAAARLRRCLRKSDIVARLGGDEFVVVLPELGDPMHAAVAARHIVAELSAPFKLATGSAFVSASVGIAVYPGDAATGDDLLRHADLAMYNAKQDGRGYVSFFEPAMNAAARHRAELESELRAALERHELELHFQPQLDLRTRRITAAEALVRWRHPSKGLVGPSEFIPFAESSGLIEAIGQWVLDKACAQIAAWRVEGLRIERLSINVSPRQFRQPGLPEAVGRALRAHAVPAALLHLEITETAVMNDQAIAVANLGGLERLGVKLELDDFGTGYSSLAQLQRLPVAAVKLDRAFISAMELSLSAQAVVKAAIEMAHAIGKAVIAEGVENAEQLALLATMRCDAVQGYHICPPLPAAQFDRFVRERTALA